MNERFDEQFGGQKFVYANERTLLPFIQQEIDLDRKRIVEIIEESKQSIIKGNNITYWKESAEKFIEKIITLITNKK